ncbi:hypothetical protein DFH07DRAFT_1011965 [Mycena maculata]|uniref:Uncharacterized protein n=1 Tax=Mycena maculata TaxID=230809 RepID=A0AAD7NLK3_9AGAR|nr:hypothetical protein DFH07DRAFT_1011965 [Mycena maculata]
MAPDSGVRYNGGRQKRLSKSPKWTSADVYGPAKTHPSAAKHLISTGRIVKMLQIAPDKKAPYTGNTEWVGKLTLLPARSSTSQDRSGNLKVEKTAVYGNGRRRRRYKIVKIIYIVVGEAFRHAKYLLQVWRPYQWWGASYRAHNFTAFDVILAQKEGGLEALAGLVG